MDFLNKDNLLKIGVAGGLLLAILSLVGLQFGLFTIFIAVAAGSYFFLRESGQTK